MKSAYTKSWIWSVIALFGLTYIMFYFDEINTVTFLIIGLGIYALFHFILYAILQFTMKYDTSAHPHGLSKEEQENLDNEEQ